VFGIWFYKEVLAADWIGQARLAWSVIRSIAYLELRSEEYDRLFKWARQKKEGQESINSFTIAFPR
jgi:hypothetical protein